MSKEKKTYFKSVDSSKKLPQVEEDVLKFWDENAIFKKSMENRKTDDDSNRYSFYDGPPFATGLPHYGHIAASVIKDVIPRYWTMKGKYIPRKWGWDCHGLPIENIVEKELGSKTKKEIEKLGVEKFNNLCRSKVLEYADEWGKIMNRLGRWADMDDSYRTMDKDFMESVWWTFKQLWDKDLIYYSYRSMHICPRCETTLSQSEVSEGYKDVKDLSVIAKFELLEKMNNEEIVPRGDAEQSEVTEEVRFQYCDNTNNTKTYILAWTTTPWTLPGNVALAVGKKIDYVKINKKNESKNGDINFILAKNKLEETFGPAKNKKVFLFSGKHSFASRKYFPELRVLLTNAGYDITIIDHVNSSNPNLSENLKVLKKYNFNNAHIITHSLGASTILKHLSNANISVSTLTMLAPTYPGISLSSTSKTWEKKSGYANLKVDFEKVKKQIKNNFTIIYSDESLIKKETFEKLGKKLGASMHKEENKGHFFEATSTNAPDFDIITHLSKFVNYEIVEEIKGSELVGKKYKPLWNTYAGDKNLDNVGNGWQIYSADFVTTDEGVGVVHIAPAFGEDDMALGKEKNLPFVQHVGMDGVVDKKVEAIGGLNVKPIDNPQATDVEVIKYLAGKNLLFSKKKYEHSYPHCWRCDTPLINYATGSWFVAVTKIKEQLLENAKGINWTPEHLKEGRFGKWLEGGRDWSISRQRFWASVLPIWVCNKCEDKKVFGSIAELKDASGVEVNDLHKHIVDEISFSCSANGCTGTMHRVPDVLDTWFDSGSMPYGQAHYPFENKKKFEKNFPADFIAEGIDQTRAWFYYLHVIAGGIFEKEAFKNVVVNGIVLAEDGQKMAKKLQNYPDPIEMINKYGADPLKFYLAQSPVVNANDLNFSEKDLAEIAWGPFRMLWQSYSFFVMYANVDEWKVKYEGVPKVDNLLDKWLLSELHQLIRDVNKEMESYHLMQATRLFAPFIDNLSNWYIRRSRKRFWKSEDDDDKNEAYKTLHYVLVELSETIAPFAPFIADEIYKNLTGGESVHLVDYPVANESLIDENVNKLMADVREVIKVGLQLRAKNQIKVRQPLSELIIKNEQQLKISDKLIEITKEELNVKKVVIGDAEVKNINNFAWDENQGIGLNTKITPKLKAEGQAREIIRAIQQMRKEADYQLDDRIKVSYIGFNKIFSSKELNKLIVKETLANTLSSEKFSNADLEKIVFIDGAELSLSIKK